MNKASKFTTGILAVMTALACGSTVLAEGTTYTGQTGSSVNVEKYLVMDQNANVPNVTFSYAIAAGAAQDASDGNAAVYAGNDANKVTGTPTAASVTFAAGDTTYTTPQDLGGNTKAPAGTKDAVTLAAGEKYARKEIAVDFSGVTFKEPGVYRYVLTESASSSLGITDDSDTTRIMDVYVEDNNGALAITGYVLHNNEADAKVPTDGSLPTVASGKAKGFQNTYTTHDLTISKTVSGNAASHDEYFEFKVKIEGAVAGTVYDVDLANADATTKTNAINTTAHTNPASLTVGSDGTIEQSFWLQHGQSIMIKGLANNTKYTITEDDATLDKSGYTTTVAQTGDTDGTFTADARKLENAAITADTTDAFTNAKSTTIPTGLYQMILPSVLFVGIALIGITMYIRKNKSVKA